MVMLAFSSKCHSAYVQPLIAIFMNALSDLFLAGAKSDTYVVQTSIYSPSCLVSLGGVWPKKRNSLTVQNFYCCKSIHFSLAYIVRWAVTWCDLFYSLIWTPCRRRKHMKKILVLESNILFSILGNSRRFFFLFFFKQIILKKPLRVKINPSVNSFHSNSELSW